MGLRRWLSHSLVGGSSPHRPQAARGRDGSDNDSITPLFRQAVTRHAQGDLDAAEAIYHTILKKDPDFVPGLHLLGRIHAQRQALGEAEACLERARLLSPDDVDVLADLAKVRRLSGRAHEARLLIENALSLD
ncbi:MAG TPA: tetratricopeptide repeat protein, partial [Gammaproteobacteria bacterium]|nr:tetratricopeptide repeat protein [Gammaproteobacteria bacterium]